MAGQKNWRSFVFKSFTLTCFLVLTANSSICSAGGDDDKTCSLKLRTDSGAKFTTRADFNGSILVDNTEQKRIENIPLVVAAQFKFEQFPVSETDAVRRYETARARIELNGLSTENLLGENNRQIAVRITDRSQTRPVAYLSVGGVLRQTEQELLMVPGDPLIFERLFARDEISVGTRWTGDPRAVAGLLAIDSVIENKFELLVKEITEESIKVYIMGDVAGEVDTATTRMHVVGVAIIDRKTESVSALRVTIDEEREISQLAPGFKGQIKIDVRSAAVTEKGSEMESFRQVSGARISQLPTRLLWDSESQFELVYDPQWRIILSDPQAVIMRYVSGGNLLAQCSILRLPRRPANKPLQKDQFVAEIRKMIAESKDARVITSDVNTTRSGLNVLRVIVHGTQEELPVEWRYYHVSNSDGRCMAMVVTAEQEAAQLFGSADIRLIESVRFPAETAEGRSASSSSEAPNRK